MQSSLLDVRLLGRHQGAALLATAVDFGAMIGLVEVATLAPPLATLISAVCGGLVNFHLGRAWTFRDVHTGSRRAQAARYAVVSLGGALLNAGFLGLALEVSSLSYTLSRVAVSCAVSVFYTYPMQARVVFRAAPRRGSAAEAPCLES